MRCCGVWTRDGRFHVNPIADVCNLTVIRAFCTYWKCTKTTTRLDEIDNHKELDAEEALPELEDLGLEQTMNGVGFRECESPSKE
jgi:hypothetical protein